MCSVLVTKQHMTKLSSKCVKTIHSTHQIEYSRTAQKSVIVMYCVVLLMVTLCINIIVKVCMGGVNNSTQQNCGTHAQNVSTSNSKNLVFGHALYKLTIIESMVILNLYTLIITSGNNLV
jgi:uncharacterized membrane protein